MDDDLFRALSVPLEPVAVVDDMSFSNHDEKSGPWRNYLVGVVGSVAAEEEEILWPNRVCTFAIALRCRARWVGMRAGNKHSFSEHLGCRNKLSLFAHPQWRKTTWQRKIS
jgi:hypothetical protein